MRRKLGHWPSIQDEANVEGSMDRAEGPHILAEHSVVTPHMYHQFLSRAIQLYVTWILKHNHSWTTLIPRAELLQEYCRHKFSSIAFRSANLLQALR